MSKPSRHLANALIIAGDFNIRDEEMCEGTDALKAHWRDAWMACGEDLQHKFTWDAVRNSRIASTFFSRPRFRFDRMYVRRDAAIDIQSFILLGTTKVQGTYPSDQFALLVWHV